MNDRSALPIMNHLTPLRASDPKPAPKEGEKSGHFQKVLDQVSNRDETPGTEKEKGPLKPIATDATPHPARSGSHAVDGKDREEEKHPVPDAKSEEAPPDPVAGDLAQMTTAGFVNPPAMNLPATIPPATVVQNPSSDGPSFVRSPAQEKGLLGVTSPPKEAQPAAPKQVDLTPIAAAEPQKEKSDPIGPTRQTNQRTAATETETPSKQVGRSDQSASDRLSPLVGKGAQPLVSAEVHSQKAVAHSGSAPSATPKEALSKGLHPSLKAESVTATGKENNLLSTSSDSETNQEESEGAGAEKGSKGADRVQLFANEMASNLIAPPSSISPANNRTENIARSADSVESKGTPGLTPPVGAPDGRELLHQIAEKWSLSHGKDGHSFRLQLEPETLGTLQIDISIHQERVTAEVVTKHPYVKALLEGNQELLRGTLADQGLKVDRFSVSLGNPGQASLGWENQLRQRGSDAPFYASGGPSLFSTEREETPVEQQWMIQEARSAISIYI